MEIKDELTGYHKAGYPLLYLVTPEERRAERQIQEVITSGKGVKGFRWSLTEGWRTMEAGGNGEPINDAKDPVAALHYVREAPDESILVLRDFHPFLESEEVLRWLRDLIPLCKATGRMIVILSPTLVLPADIAKDTTVVDLRPPTREELDRVLSKVVGAVKAVIPIPDRKALIEAALGLTEAEAENAFALALVRHKTLNGDAIRTIQHEKAQVIKKSGMLEVVETKAGLENVGGLALFKAWLKSRARGFTDAAKAFGLPTPKGVLALGCPGSGKSLIAQSVARTWNLPILRLDMGRVFAGRVGQSEDNMRQVIKAAEAMAPCILWIDEIEKGAAGLASGGNLDSGVTARVVGTLLTWQQEKTAPVFLFATANRVDQLPPELLRKGRFDEIFYVDLPTAAEREEIFKIHLAKRNWLEKLPEGLSASLAALTAGYTGAEIEAGIVDGLFRAFDANRQPLPEDFVAALEATVPLSVTMREQITATREWAKTRARPASERTPDVPVASPGQAPIGDRRVLPQDPSSSAMNN